MISSLISSSLTKPTTTTNDTLRGHLALSRHETTRPRHENGYDNDATEDRNQSWISHKSLEMMMLMWKLKKIKCRCGVVCLEYRVDC